MVSVAVRSLQTWVSVPRFKPASRTCVQAGQRQRLGLLRSLFVVSLSSALRAMLNRNLSPQNLRPHRLRY